MVFKKVAIFGVFDGIHEGHRQFISEAKEQALKLVAIVARDNSVLELKNKTPKFSEIVRLNAVFNTNGIDWALLGDREQGSYEVLRELEPDAIYLGYDQQDLHKDLLEKMKDGILPEMELIFGKAYQPDLFHSSILNK